MDYHGGSSSAAENPKYLKRKVKSGHVKLDSERRDLVLIYEIEAAVVGDTGKTMRTERKTHRMNMNVKLDAHTDVRSYAEKLVDQSDLIPSHKVDHVEDLLLELKELIMDDRRRSDPVRKMKQDAERRRREERKREQRRLDEEQKAKEEAENATMDDIEDYVENLYDEDISSRISATRMILKLASDAGNLEDLAEHDRLLGALSRTLREDCRKSIDLAMNIMKVFCAFAVFSHFHDYLQAHQVGSNTMYMVKWELERHQSRVNEMEQLEQVAEAQAAGETPFFDPRKAKIQHEPVDMDAERAKTKNLERKQDKLLCLCIQVLLCLAEDERVEKKMAKRELTQDLVQLLGSRTSRHGELLILTCIFLQKLSVTKENKNVLRDHGAVELLLSLLACSNEKLLKVVLGAVFNLSFDQDIREQMRNSNALPKLVDLLQEKTYRAMTLRILYHLSVDDKCKNMFTYTELIPYVMKMMIDFPGNHVGKELAALAINLSLNERNCNFMCQGSNFKKVIERAMKRQDPLLMKFCVNISVWTLKTQERLPDDHKESYKQARMWAPYIEDLAKVMMSTDDQAVMVEVMGIFANLSPMDLPKTVSFPDLILDNDMVEFFHKHLLPGFSEDDVLLQVVMIVGQFCLDEAAARMLSNSPVIKLVYDLLHEKQEDTEILLQTLHVFFRLLRQRDTGHALLYETQMPRDVCDLLEHPNRVVQVMADTVLDLIVDHDEANEVSLEKSRKLARDALNGTLEGKRSDSNDSKDNDNPANDSPEGYALIQGTLSKMIRSRRFAIHNKEWLQMAAQEELDDLEDPVPDFQYPSDVESLEY